MHIAICDDNVADRKHLERLLSRESDKRAGTPNILDVDSYGEKMHFLANPLKYNLIFMDMSTEPGIVEFIIEHLNAMGYHAPLVLYSDKIDYTQIPNLPDYVVHAQKPYIPDFWRWAMQTSPDMLSLCPYIRTRCSPISPST